MESRQTISKLLKTKYPMIFKELENIMNEKYRNTKTKYMKQYRDNKILCNDCNNYYIKGQYKLHCKRKQHCEMLQKVAK